MSDPHTHSIGLREDIEGLHLILDGELPIPGVTEEDIVSWFNFCPECGEKLPEWCDDMIGPHDPAPTTR